MPADALDELAFRAPATFVRAWTELREALCRVGMPGLRDNSTTFWRREPFLSFSIFGGLTFLLLSPFLASNKETIVIDARTRDSVVERRTNLEGRELSSEERDQAIADYLRDEILVREAYRNGWHLENGRVRQRLVLAMRTALNEDVPEPSIAQLQAFFRANAERYRVPPSVTLAHVFFEAGLSHDPKQVLAYLREGRDSRDLDDPARLLGAEVLRIAETRLAETLGESFAARVFALTPGSWSGPIDSNRGRHYVRVETRHDGELPPFEVSEPHLRLHWDRTRRDEIYERKMERMREDYAVHVETP